MDASGEQVASRGNGKFLLLVAVILVASLAFYELTQHLGQVRPGDTESRLQTWNRLESRLRNGDDGSTDIYAASCLLSKVRNPGSKYFGENNPHLKLAACRSGVCDYAIIGLLFGSPAVVTARGGVPITVYHTEVRKDACVQINVSDALAVLDGKVPLP